MTVMALIEDLLFGSLGLVTRKCAREPYPTDPDVIEEQYPLGHLVVSYREPQTQRGVGPCKKCMGLIVAHYKVAQRIRIPPSRSYQPILKPGIYYL